MLDDGSFFDFYKIAIEKITNSDLDRQNDAKFYQISVYFVRI